MSFIPFLSNAGAGPMSLGGTLIPLLFIIVIFYFFLIRPQNKKQKETEKMLNALKKGDKVVTIGGIHGVISSVKENTIIVKVDDGAKIEFNRSAISAKLKSDEELAKEAAAKAAKEAEIQAKKDAKTAKKAAKKGTPVEAAAPAPEAAAETPAEEKPAETTEESK